MLDLEGQDKVMMVRSAASMIISDEEKRIRLIRSRACTGGEAAPWADPIHKVTIHSRAWFGSDSATAHGRKAYLSQGISAQHLVILFCGRRGRRACVGINDDGRGTDIERRRIWRAALVCDVGMSES